MHILFDLCNRMLSEPACKGIHCNMLCIVYTTTWVWFTYSFNSIILVFLLFIYITISEIHDLTTTVGFPLTRNQFFERKRKNYPSLEEQVNAWKLASRICSRVVYRQGHTLLNEAELFLILTYHANRLKEPRLCNKISWREEILKQFLEWRVTAELHIN